MLSRMVLDCSGSQSDKDMVVFFALVCNTKMIRDLEVD